MYIEQTNAYLMDSLLYCSLFIAPTCCNANASSSGSHHLVPAKLYELVHVVLVIFIIYFHIRFFRVVKTLKRS